VNRPGYSPLQFKFNFALFSADENNDKNLPDLMDKFCKMSDENNPNTDNVRKAANKRGPVLKTSFFHKEQQKPMKATDTFEKNYQFAKHIEEKRKRDLEQKELELKKARQFVAKPAPKFKSPARPKPSEPKITVPETPQQMKPDRLKKVIELKKKIEKEVHPPAPVFKAHKPKVLVEEPFIPKKEKRAVVQAPFNLRSSARVAERKNFEEDLERRRQEKHRLEEEERRRKDEEEIRKLRKEKEFKANPNPFR
jgi:hypothetical protein